ncbi:3',5'-cyclic-AMP phosphodiesterase [Teredinibacter sp. KSP-S5-2]|uniref:3',5'-cyclic-AMP phosphodiesterase n=1 Tax=Teredinibacter sp. KSP-S5-2 TaxID=3034506 RepID=UPI002935233A|nr:3',5'-cyclic-AMP phosphodiesterase [Teredinibacter sp. KSP-S5-2]WNO09399.1 3',5'-cyclic-AMP phosphodiesterase [Teredinibacter sp. KSP-S5-2]
MRPFRLLQITDCHLGSQPGEKLLGLDTDQSLYDVLQMVRAQETPDLILATGDISNDAGAASYERFIHIVKRYFPQSPIAWLPGNHDDPMNMDLVEDLPIEARHIAGGWNLIFLDSRIPMEEGGELHPTELERLERELATIKLPTMIFLHHQPVPVECEWIDQYVVKNADQFFKIVDRYSQVKVICWGHVHQEFHTQRRNVDLYATPSTCIQFTPCSKNFSVDSAMPGYRMFELYRNGRYDTFVKRIADKVYNIDFASAGY